MRNNFFYIQLFKSLIFSYDKIGIIIVALCIATAVSAAFLNIYFDIENKFSKELKAYGANMMLLPAFEKNTIPKQAYEKLSKEFKISPYLYAFLNVNGSNTLVLGADFQALKLMRPFIELKAGSFSLSDFDENTAFLGIDLASAMISANKQNTLTSLIGQNVELNLNAQKYILKIKGILAGSELDGVLIAPLAKVQNLSAISGIHYAELLHNGDFQTLKAKALALSNEDFSLKPLSAISLSEALVLDKIKILMLLIALVVLIIACMSVHTSLSAIIFSRKKEIALQLVLGASKKDIIKLFAWESFILIIFASLLGLIVGFFLAHIFAYLVFNTSISFHFAAFFLSFIISLFFGFFAVFFPIKKALSINLSENLKGV